MATNPLIQVGSLNRLRGSLVLANFQALNVTSSYLGKRGISLQLNGNATEMIDVMTGRVTSPEPYMPIDVTISLLKTQALSGSWLAQVQKGSVLGNGTVYPDSSAFPQFDFLNAAVTHIASMSLAGDDPTVNFTLSGTFLINSDMWNLT